MSPNVCVNKNEEKMFTVKQAAQLLMVHPDTIRRWADKDAIKSNRHPVNNYRVFRIADLLEMKCKILNLKSV